jgi:hypothetical protein
LAQQAFSSVRLVDLYCPCHAAASQMNVTIVVEASGELLLGVLENSVSQLPKQEGRFVQVGSCAGSLAGWRC